MSNKLSPQDYVNLIVRYVNKKHKSLLNSTFTFDKIYKFCLKNTEVLDDGDEKYIKQIIENTIDTLETCGNVIKKGYVYVVKKQVSLSESLFPVEDNVPNMNLTKEQFDKLNKICTESEEKSF